MAKNIAVILAGGIGTRTGIDKPKQFLKLGGKMVIEHTIERFQNNDKINEIAVVCHKDYITLIENIINRNHYDKVKKVLVGGETRNDSSLVAVRAYESDDVNLIFHDAVRPLVSDRIINDCIKALDTYNAVDVAIPMADTIISVNNDLIDYIPDRDYLRRGQTPQAFKINTIKRAYDLALQDKNFKASDDCGVVKKYLPNEPVYVVLGDETNMKLTYAIDLFLLDKLFQMQNVRLYGNKSSLKILEDKVLVVFGGSSGIGRAIVNIASNYNFRVYSYNRRNGIDVSKAEDVQSALDKAYKKEGKIDFVIDTAGILVKEPINNMNYKDIVESINTNFLGSIIVAKESFRYLQETHGELLLFASSSYTLGRANYSIYSSTKAAVVNFMQAIADEWDTFDIRVNCISPERTLTPMRIKNFGNENPADLLKPEEVAYVALQTLLMPFSGQVVDVKLGGQK